MEITKADIEKMEFLLVEGIKSSDIDFLDKTIHDDFAEICEDEDFELNYWFKAFFVGCKK